MTDRTERLFYFNHMLRRWGGFDSVVNVTCSPISVTAYLHINELEAVEQYILENHYPKRLRIALYIVGVSQHPDCVFHFEDGKLQCIEESIYPINRLRNIAIRNAMSSHFVVFDMDMWPASRDRRRK